MGIRWPKSDDSNLEDYTNAITALTETLAEATTKALEATHRLQDAAKELDRASASARETIRIMQRSNSRS